MATRTTNYNLYQWEPGDEKRETIEQMAGNARMIDEALKGLDNRIGSNDSDISAIQGDIRGIRTDMGNLSDDLADLRDDLPTIENWKGLPLSSAVAAYGAGFVSPSYRKDSFGMVSVRGLIRTSGTPSGDIDLATLPTGYRPSGMMVAMGWASLVGGEERPIRINVRTDGRIQAATGTTGAVYVSLDSIQPFEGV